MQPFSLWTSSEVHPKVRSAGAQFFQAADSQPFFFRTGNAGI
jgi:hypothetical protein